MSGTMDRTRVQAPRPWISTPTTLQRSPPKPRLAAQALPPSVNASLQPRRPLAVVNTSTVSRQSPSSGRSTPINAGSNITPRSGPRVGYFQAAQTTTATTMSKSTSTTNIINVPVVRPRLARGTTTSSLPAIGERQRLNTLKNNGLSIGGPTSRAASPAISQPQVVSERPRISPAVHKAPSFFHADEVRLRNSDPKPTPMNGTMHSLYHNSKLVDSTTDGRNEQEHFPKSVLSPETHNEEANPSAYAFMDAETVHILTNYVPHTDSTEPVLDLISSKFVHADSLPKKEITTPTEKEASPSIYPGLQDTATTALQSKRLSGNGQRRTSNLDTTITPQPNQAKTRTTSFTNGIVSKSNNVTATPSTAPPNRSNRSSINPAEPPSSVLSSSTDSESHEVSQPPSQAGIAASARHERKLLDLEISNSSLLAINRTLEREVAKQKAELKRLRRATVNRSSWISDNTDSSSEVGSRLSISGEDDSFMKEEDTDIDGQTRSLDGSRRQSQRKIELDLSKQRELLIDSQRLNMTIQRCLGVTDRLIKEGDTALEYQVDPSNFAATSVGENTYEDMEIQDPHQSLSTPESRGDNQSAAQNFFDTWASLSTKKARFDSTLGPQISAFPNVDPDIRSIDRDSGIDVDYSSAEPGTEAGVPLKGRWRNLPHTPLEEIEKEMF